MASLAEPPVAKAAQILWYQSKALELMAHFLFDPRTRNFSACGKKASRGNGWNGPRNCWRAIWPILADTGDARTGSRLQSVLLSRIFSREVGHTIPQYLRNIRMERAAELLRSGRFNVTEAAIQVGATPV